MAENPLRKHASRVLPDPKYDNAAGVPDGYRGGAGKYKDTAEAALPKGPGTSAQPQGKPFKLGGG